MYAYICPYILLLSTIMIAKPFFIKPLASTTPQKFHSLGQNDWWWWW